MISINPNNRFELEGRVTNLKEYAPGKAADITIAIDNGKGKDPTYLHTKSFNPAVYNTITTGMKIHIFGHISPSQYEKDGRTIYSTDLVDDYITFLESKSVVVARNLSKVAATDIDDDTAPVEF